MRTKRDRRRWWIVPVLCRGAEIEGFWVRALDGDEARALAVPIFDQHGYTEEKHYHLGEPIASDDL